ncbi:MAG: MFS transporter [Gammaproteobacteria bacterium]
MKLLSLQARYFPFQLILLMLSVFTVFVGYGIALPVLPFLLQNRFGNDPDFSVAWHTGMMTGVFMITLFLFAPLWGKVSDRFGRRPVILIGLGGCVIALLVFGIVETLWLGYFTRAVGGAVVSAVLPVAFAYVSDISSRQLRAQRFALLSAASTLGFLIGPGLGGWLSGSSISGTILGIDATGLPFIVGAIAGLLVWILVYVGLSESTGVSFMTIRTPIRNYLHWQKTPFNSLLVLALLGMFGLGSFEVSLALHGKEFLDLTSFQIGMLFIECSIMMILVQVLLFSVLIRNFNFIQIITVALLIMALGLGLLPITSRFDVVILATGLVGIGSGVLIPLLAYQTSLDAGALQGSALGKQTAAGSLGQGLGSILAGILFGITYQAPFWFTAGLLVAGALVGLKFGRVQPVSR